MKGKEQAPLPSWHSIVLSFKNKRITLFLLNEWFSTNEASVSFAHAYGAKHGLKSESRPQDFRHEVQEETFARRTV